MKHLVVALAATAVSALTISCTHQAPRSKAPSQTQITSVPVTNTPPGVVYGPPAMPGGTTPLPPPTPDPVPERRR